MEEEPSNVSTTTNGEMEGNKSPQRGSVTEIPTLRARRFPTPRTGHFWTPTLRRRTTATQEIGMHSLDSIHDHGLTEAIFAPNTPKTTGDPFLSVIYPAKFGRESEGDNETSEMEISMRQRDSICRTQVRVEGYFQDESEGFVALIPNDLPRSTFLYVLTASEGRDKLFKCLQYGLQLMICLLKRPMLFTTDSQQFAGYWAERFWRNINTIRHGRSLFKLGRWVLNLFFLEDIYGRLALKYGSMGREMMNGLESSLGQFLRLSSTWCALSRSRNDGSLGMENSMGAVSKQNVESLLTDDMYFYAARAEFPWMKTPTSLSMMPMVREAGKQTLADNITTTRFYVKEKFYNSIFEMESKRDHPQQREQLDIRPATSKNGSPDTAGSFLSPPSLHSTLAATSYLGTRRHHGQQARRPFEKLLHPLCATGDDDDGSYHPDAPSYTPSMNTDNNTIELATESSSPKRGEKFLHTTHSAADGNKTDPCRGFFASYQVLPYEPRLGDALHSPRGNNNNNNTNNAALPYSGTRGPVCSTKFLSTVEDPDHNVNSEARQDDGNHSDVSLTSSGILGVKGYKDCVLGGEQGIPAEMGNPAHWRKRLLQFSTPLMLLLGVRTISTIGRRIVRDILLLSSERFLNVSCVEKNRPLLQRRANWLWLAVSSIDLFLNTIRLMNRGWYKYATARHSALYHCRCKDYDETDFTWRYRDLIARRKVDLYFPEVDFDFGAPLCSSPAYFEAADPEHIAPACLTCGCLFVESHSDAADDLPKQEEKAGRKRDPNGKPLGGFREKEEIVCRRGNETVRPKSFGTAAQPTMAERAEVAILLIPWMVRKLLNYLLLLRVHPNWTATILLQLRYMTEVYLAFMYCLGGYETGKSDAALEEMLHVPGAIAGLLGAVIGLHRVMKSAPK
ncbi:hypothetical protein ECC02_003074 [Trypanosoma cruzi]|uniref:Uncharacterized protein n=1 Tax=Trypanosoma cruzi TaxID=5693 RepID=A0A7J6YBU0_TRYCR|nr:hypothetical protein ECC02_003074 [Trypanosoma cruzi]